MNRFKVTVTNVDAQISLVEIHQADSWQSAVLCHSLVGAEFEELVDEDDLHKRCETYGYRIQVLPL